MTLPTDAKLRKLLPIGTGVLDYFPDALAAIAEVSRLGNEQHNPGQPLHWAKEKSTDHDDCAIRHFLERKDLYARAQFAWRALAGLQIAIEQAEAAKADVAIDKAEEKYRTPTYDREVAAAAQAVEHAYQEQGQPKVVADRSRQVAGHGGFRFRLNDGTIVTDPNDLRIDVV